MKKIRKKNIPNGVSLNETKWLKSTNDGMHKMNLSLSYIEMTTKNYEKNVNVLDYMEYDVCCYDYSETVKCCCRKTNLLTSEHVCE